MRKLWIVVLVFVLLAVGLAVPLAAQVNVSNFDNLRTDGFMRADTYLRSGTYAQVGTFLQIDPATHITYTTGALTPLGTNQTVCVGSNRGLTNVTVLDAGTIVNFTNNCSATIGFTDTAPLVLGGNRVLGQYDVLIVKSDGTRWIEQAYINN